MKDACDFYTKRTRLIRHYLSLETRTTQITGEMISLEIEEVDTTFLTWLLEIQKSNLNIYLVFWMKRPILKPVGSDHQ